MGFFSWKTSDTKKSIANHYSSRKTFTVYMITEDQMIFTEPDYEGYGKFGDKDVYELISEMNQLKGKEGEESRILAIDLLYRTQITNGTRTYTQGSGSDADFFNWETPMPLEDGKTPNQLVKEGWKQVHPNGYGEWNIAAKNGIKLPKFVTKLPKADANWKEFWDSLPYPENCKYQGYFY